MSNPVTLTTEESPAVKRTRAKLEALVWRHTHRDFKGLIDGIRTVLHLAPGGTCVVALSSLTDAELFDKLPSRVRAELPPEVRS